LATRVVTYRRVEWAKDSFAPYRSTGVDGIFPALLQQAREVLFPHLVRIFRACLATGYVPAMWRQVKVVFILKPGRNSYSGPRDYRPISLTSFLLKTMERLVDRYLRDETLARVPLHSNQHAYQAGKSVETALHQLVVRVEKALDQQVISFGAFLDIEGAFNNTCYDTMCDAVVKTWEREHHCSVDSGHPGGPRGFCDPQWNFREARDIQGLPSGRCTVLFSGAWW
jgi:hypothetical protein